MHLSKRFAVPLLAVFSLAWSAGPVLVARQTGSPKKITHVDPVYPELARQARIQGTWDSLRTMATAPSAERDELPGRPRHPGLEGNRA